MTAIVMLMAIRDMLKWMRTRIEVLQADVTAGLADQMEARHDYAAEQTTSSEESISSNNIADFQQCVPLIGKYSVRFALYSIK